MTKKITFPHIGNYYIPIKYLIKKSLAQDIKLKDFYLYSI